VSKRSSPAVVGGSVEIRRATETTTITQTDYVGSRRDCRSRPGCCRHCCSPALSSSRTCCRTGRSRRRSHATPTYDQTPLTPGTYAQTRADIHTTKYTHENPSHDISTALFNALLPSFQCFDNLDKNPEPERKSQQRRSPRKCLLKLCLYMCAFVCGTDAYTGQRLHPLNRLPNFHYKYLCT